MNVCSNEDSSSCFCDGPGDASADTPAASADRLDRNKLAKYCANQFNWKLSKAKHLVDECIDRFLFIRRNATTTTLNSSHHLPTSTAFGTSSFCTKRFVEVSSHKQVAMTNCVKWHLPAFLVEAYKSH